MNVSLFDLKDQYQSIANEIDSAIQRVVSSGHFVLGPEVENLENEIAVYLGAKHAVGVASGTDALLLSLLACDVGAQDEVITTPFTFIATVESIIHVGAKPVFVDIDPETFNIDTKKMAQKISSKTKAIIPVHMFGQSVDMEAVLSFAKTNNIAVIEDAAQGFGAEYKGNKVGTLGKTGCFSFFPTKNFGAYGDAGMIVTDDESIAKTVRMLRVHGSDRKYTHARIGYNSRIDALQAAILRVKLKYIDEWNNNRRKIAAKYNELLSELDLVLPFEKEGNKHIYHQFTIRSKKRDQCKDFLAARGVTTAIHYPFSSHEQECLQFLKIKGEELTVSKTMADQVLSLPMYPELIEEQVIYVCKMIKDFFG